MKLALLGALVMVAAGCSRSGDGDGTGLVLSWTDNSDNEDGFVIERRIPSATFAELARVGANVATYTDATTAAGVQVCYRVHAYNSAGESAFSNEACGTAVAGRQAILRLGPTDVTAVTR